MGAPKVSVRVATPADADEVARVLHDFNAEFGDFTPEVEKLSETVERLIAEGEIVVLVAGEGPDGLAELRLRPSVFAGSTEAYLEELYVVPELRGRGIGRALLEAAMQEARERGATHIDLTTSEDDVAARRLYEDMGFTNREGRPDGPVMLYYERDL